MEIGCGGGTAAALVCGRLCTGSVTAIDRSLTAVKKTLARNESYVTAGRLTVLQAPFTLAGVGELVGFDKIFSINVNLFWTTPAREELDLLRRMLVPGGRRCVRRRSPRPAWRHAGWTLSRTTRSSRST